MGIVPGLFQSMCLESAECDVSMPPYGVLAPLITSSLQALSSYASLLDRSSPSMGPPSTASPTQTPQDRILASAAGQAAASRSQAAADLLVLLTYIGNTRSMGVFTVSSSQSQHMQQSMIPAVSHSLWDTPIILSSTAFLENSSVPLCTPLIRLPSSSSRTDELRLEARCMLICWHRSLLPHMLAAWHSGLIIMPYSQSVRGSSCDDFKDLRSMQCRWKRP